MNEIVDRGDQKKAATLVQPRKQSRSACDLQVFLSWLFLDMVRHRIWRQWPFLWLRGRVWVWTRLFHSLRTSQQSGSVGLTDWARFIFRAYAAFRSQKAAWASVACLPIPCNFTIAGESREGTTILPTNRFSVNPKVKGNPPQSRRNCTRLSCVLFTSYTVSFRCPEDSH